MADGSCPDITQQLLQQQSMIASAASAGKPAFILMGLPAEVNAGAGLALKGRGLNADGMIMKLPQAKPKFCDKFLQAVSSMKEDLAKIAQGANAMYTGEITSGTFVSSGSGFTQMAGNSQGNDMGPGPG